MMERNIEKHFSEIVQLIRKAKNNALKSVNKELINLYWQVGKYINGKVESVIWGTGVVKSLAAYLKEKEPDLKGFSAQNLWRMKQFYETYRNHEKLSTLLRELPWSSHLHILAKTKNIEEKGFYLRLAVKERHSVRELERQIDSGLYERTMISNTNLSPVLKDKYPAISSVFMETYVLDFLNLPKPFSEKDLQKGIAQNLKNFLNLSPSLVAEYKTKLIDKKVLQRKLHELFLISEPQDTGNDKP